jgi:hypothetical protein
LADSYSWREAAKHQLCEVRLMAAREITERAWGRPKDFDPAAEKDESKLRFDPRMYSAADLAIIEAGLRLQLAGRSAPAEPEVIPAGDG